MKGNARLLFRKYRGSRAGIAAIVDAVDQVDQVDQVDGAGRMRFSPAPSPKPQAPKPRAAFTIAELLVSIAILAVLGLAMTTIMRSGLTAWRQGQKRTDTDAAAQLVMDQIADDFGSIFTKSIQPPGPVTIELPTLKEMEARRADRPDFYANEWCAFNLTDDFYSMAGELASAGGRYLYAPNDGASCTFRFRLRFVTRKAHVWIASSGASSTPESRLKLEAKIVTQENKDDTAAGWLPQSEWPEGDLTRLIPQDGTDCIMIKATFDVDEELQTWNGQGYVLDATHPSQPRLLVGDEGPVLRFTAEPDATAVGRVQFMLVQPPNMPGEPQKAVFVRNFGRRADPFAMQEDEAHGSLGEVCYLTTFGDEPNGIRSLTGTLWRAVRKPLGNWIVDGQLPPVSSPLTSFFERDFIGLGGTGGISALSTSVAGLNNTWGSAYLREQGEKMAQSGFYPIAENVLYFGIQAWDDSLFIPGWTDDWDPARGVPPKARVVLVLENQESRPTIARLKYRLEADTTTDRIELDGAADFEFFAEDSPAQRYVKIDNEWIYYDNVTGGRTLLYDPSPGAFPGETGRPCNNTNRAQRGTAGAPHDAGADVHQGETYVRIIPLPYPKLIPQQPQGQQGDDYREERY